MGRGSAFKRWFGHLTRHLETYTFTIGLPFEIWESTPSYTFGVRRITPGHDFTYVTLQLSVVSGHYARDLDLLLGDVEDRLEDQLPGYGTYDPIVSVESDSWTEYFQVILFMPTQEVV
jgi:hypothetical protein